MSELSPALWLPLLCDIDKYSIMRDELYRVSGHQLTIVVKLKPIVGINVTGKLRTCNIPETMINPISSREGGSDSYPLAESEIH